MAFSSTITRLLAGLVWLGAATTGVLAQEAAATVPFVYLSRAGDPAYEPRESYTGLVLRDRHRPIDGARTALRESRVLGRALGLSFELIEQELGESEPAAARLREIASTAGAAIFLLDLPLDDVVAIGRESAADPDLIAFNIRHRENSLRGEACSPVLFHTIASDAMLTDALAQLLQSRGWTDILMLTGPEPEDASRALSFRASAEKFALSIEDERAFVLGNDPRSREQTNVALLTGGSDYDAVFLADEVGEYGRYVPFSTYLPRPVVGAEGLAGSTWHWTWERHGAPQLNQRFDRIAKRQMSDEDWAAWAAVRAAVEAVVRTRATGGAEIRAYLRTPDLNLDLYKGIPGSFRSWDNQLRQPILLHTHNAVVAWAPMQGFLHQTNVLDSLGTDEPETECRLRPQ